VLSQAADCPESHADYWDALTEFLLQGRIDQVGHFHYRYPFYQCWGSVTFWCGSGPADSHLYLMDPDPTPDLTPFFCDFKDANNYFRKGKVPGAGSVIHTDYWIRIRIWRPKPCGSCGSGSGSPTLHFMLVGY
jgi:hypothetical protein